LGNSSGRIAGKVRANVRGRNRCINGFTSHGRIAGKDLALIAVITDRGGLGCGNALRSSGFSRHIQNTSIISASIAVVAIVRLGSYCTDRERSTNALIGFNNTLVVVTSVRRASCFSRNRNGDLSAPYSNVATVSEALTGHIAGTRGLGSEDTLGSLRFSWVGQNTSVIGTRVVVVTVHSLGGNSANGYVCARSGGCSHDTHGCITRV
jgi:hypothetical protein